MNAVMSLPAARDDAVTLDLVEDVAGFLALRRSGSFAYQGIGEIGLDARSVTSPCDRLDQDAFELRIERHDLHLVATGVQLLDNGAS